MFVKLLALLISNIFVSFSVLLCCRSLASICGLKGENDLKVKIWSPCQCARVQQTRLSMPACECVEPRSSTTALERTPCQPVALASSHSCLCRGIIEWLRALEGTIYDQAHIGMCSSALTCDQAHPRDRQHIIFVINRTSFIICKPTFWRHPWG